MADALQDLTDIPKDFFKDGTAFLNRCTKRSLSHMPYSSHCAPFPESPFPVMMNMPMPKFYPSHVSLLTSLQPTVANSSKSAKQLAWVSWSWVSSATSSSSSTSQ
jgi:hypothetical protein